MVLREAQNHKNNKLPFFIRKVNPYFELLLFSAYLIFLIFCCYSTVIRNFIKPLKISRFMALPKTFNIPKEQSESLFFV